MFRIDREMKDSRKWVMSISILPLKNNSHMRRNEFIRRKMEKNITWVIYSNKRVCIIPDNTMIYLIIPCHISIISLEFTVTFCKQQINVRYHIKKINSRDFYCLMWLSRNERVLRRLQMQLNDKEANVDEIVSFAWITHFPFVIKVM